MYRTPLRLSIPLLVPPIFQHFHALQEKQLKKLNCTSVNTTIVLFLDVMEPAPNFHTHMNVFQLLANLHVS